MRDLIEDLAHGERPLRVHVLHLVDHLLVHRAKGLWQLGRLVRDVLTAEQAPHHLDEQR